MTVSSFNRWQKLLVVVSALAESAMLQLFHYLSHQCNDNGEMQISDSNRKKGGWITFPFVAGSVFGLTLAASGSMSNLVVYLIEKFNVKSIEAAQIFNIVNGFTSLLPVIAGIIADSISGPFSLVWISSIFSFLGISLLTLTAVLHYTNPTALQFGLLYSGIALFSIGEGGSRLNLATLGANQFENAKDQGVFFNWFVVIEYVSTIIGVTLIVYIQDNVSWGLGFGLSLISNMVGLAIFLMGNRYYTHPKLQGSPFMSIARVIVASVRKRRVQLSSIMEDFYYGHNEAIQTEVSAPTKSLSFLNKAAQKKENDISLDGSISNPWELCSVQQVEDLKILIKILPVISSGIFVGIPIAVLGSFTILQALSMDRHIGSSFKIPAGSMIVFMLTSTAIFLVIMDRLVYPAYHKLTRRFPTPLQRIGAGHVLNAIGMGVAALVELKRRKRAVTHNNITDGVVPISVLWLVPQSVIVGFGEAFLAAGQVTFYYTEFPKSLGSTATGMLALNGAIAYYLSTAVVDIIQKTTSWLPDNINNGRLDYVYWILFLLGSVSFAYFLICAKFYRYQNDQ